ncbi:hypothetical protein BGX28_005137 [Mortierella sp. GBA30]|nr:hypothetical protein BGX28_005137 [Mortierella sp. GBA30]
MSTGSRAPKGAHMSRVRPVIHRSQSAYIDSPSSESASFKSPASSSSADSWGDQKQNIIKEAAEDSRLSLKDANAEDCAGASLELRPEPAPTSLSNLFQIGPIARMNFRKEQLIVDEETLFRQKIHLSVVTAKHSGLGEAPSLDLNPFSPYSLGILDTETGVPHQEDVQFKQPIDLNEYCSRVNVRPKEDEDDEDSDEEQDWEDSVQKIPDPKREDVGKKDPSPEDDKEKLPIEQVIEQVGALVGTQRVIKEADVTPSKNPLSVVESLVPISAAPPVFSDPPAFFKGSKTESEGIAKQWRLDQSTGLYIHRLGSLNAEHDAHQSISEGSQQSGPLNGKQQNHSPDLPELPYTPISRPLPGVESPIKRIPLLSSVRDPLTCIGQATMPESATSSPSSVELTEENANQATDILLKDYGPSSPTDNARHSAKKPSKIDTALPQASIRQSVATATTATIAATATATTTTTTTTTTTACTTNTTTTDMSTTTTVANASGIGSPTAPQQASPEVLGHAVMEAAMGDLRCQNQQVVSSKVSRSGKLFAKKTKTITQFEYNTSKKLGKGNFGIVYHGRRKGGDHEVAIKKITRKLPGEIEKLGLVQREMRVCRAFRNKIGIVPLLDIITTNKHHYLVFEKAETDLAEMIRMRCREANGGKSTKDLSQQQQPMSPSCSLGTVFSIQEIRSIMRTVVLGTQALHLEGYSHKDIKPANILYQNGQGMLCDFGLCSQRDELPLNQFFGTQDYAAPEARRAGGPKSNKCDYIRSDIYSLGAVLYELATGVVLSKVISRGVNYPKIALFGGTSFSELLQGMVNDPEKRWTIDQVVNSRFWSESISPILSTGLKAMAEIQQQQCPAEIPLPTTPTTPATSVGQ